jgi:hypothetical protein
MNKMEFIRNKPFDEVDGLLIQTNAESAIRDLAKTLYNPGVIEGLMVTATGVGLGLSIGLGKGFDSNYNFINILANQPIVLTAADPANPRYDLISLKFKTVTTGQADAANKYGKGTSFVFSNFIADSFDIIVTNGVAAAVPVVPATPLGNIALGAVLVGAGVTSIVAGNITDERTFTTAKNRHFVQNVIPTEGVRDGVTWYNPDTDNTKMYFNGQFRDVGGAPIVSNEVQPTTGLKEGLIWFKPSTKEVKIYLNGAFQSAGGSAFLNWENTVTLGAANNTVNIGIQSYLHGRDILMVYKNSTKLIEGTDFTVSADSLSISTVSGTWESGAVFDFLILYSTPLTDSLNTQKLTNLVVVAADNTTNIAIGITEFNSSTDVLDVQQEGNTPLWPGENYNINANGISIDLVGYAARAGEKFFFSVLKKIRSSAMSYTDGTLIQNGTVSDSKLGLDNKVGSLATLTTTAKSNAVAAINEIKSKTDTNASSITTNGNRLTVVENKTTSYNAYRTNKDTVKKIYKQVEYRRTDGSVYRRSIASNPDGSGNYQTITIQEFAADGVTVVRTETWTMTYDADGDVQNESVVIS